MTKPFRYGTQQSHEKAFYRVLKQVSKPGNVGANVANLIVTKRGVPALNVVKADNVS